MTDPPLPASTPPQAGDLPLSLVLACSRFARLSARRADVGVSSVTWRITSTLDRLGPMRLSEIAVHEQVARPTATATIQRLEAEGIVERRPDPADGRSSLVRLTDTGHEQLEVWRRRLGTSVEDLLEGLSPQDRRALTDSALILHRIIDSSEGHSTSS